MPVQGRRQLRLRGARGGGYGDPLLRDPEAVLADVLDGLVSAATARRDYGVVITADGTVDAAATTALRGAAR